LDLASFDGKKWKQSVPCLVALLALVSTACSSTEEFCDVASAFRQETIVKSVCDYYQYENSSSWDKTYDMRTAAFRRLVPVAKYVKQMTNDSKNWKLERIQIVDVQFRGNKADVDTIFFERRILEDERIPKGAIMKFRGNSIWIKNESGWFCYDCVTRAHFALNAPLASED